MAALLAWFDAASLDGVIIGGVPVGLLGRPRLTHDLDALAVTRDDRDNWPALFSSARACGLVHREADPVAFATHTRMALLRHAESGVDIDVSIGLLPFEREAVAAARLIDVAGLHVPVPTRKTWSS